MKVKNQIVLTSEADAKEKLIVYVYEYLNHIGAKGAAQLFRNEIGYGKEIQINPDGPGFLANWWYVFWDLYCAAPDKRNQIEATSEARAFHDYSSGLRPIMSPSCTQPSPPQQGMPAMGVGRGSMMPAARYGPHSGQLRAPLMGMGPRQMQNMGHVGPPPPMIGPHHPHHPSMMGNASPRYAPHPGHMTPGSSASSGPMVPETGPSPGMNRMTPNHGGSPHPQGGVPPGNGMNTMVGPPGNMHGPPMGQPISPIGPTNQGPPPSHQADWQGNTFNMNSPADQQCFMPGPPVPAGQQEEFGGMIMNDGSGILEVKPSSNNGAQTNPQQQQDEYVMPNTYGRQSDQDAGPEILKLKESLEGNPKEYTDSDQSGFGIDFPGSQNKW